jgi:hypothetical protein
MIFKQKSEHGGITKKVNPVYAVYSLLLTVLCALCDLTAVFRLKEEEQADPRTSLLLNAIASSRLQFMEVYSPCTPLRQSSGRCP